MAEVSYPFNADSAGGGQQMVSQAQWQSMAVGWGDVVDFPLSANSYVAADLPFNTSISGRDVTVNAGSARVGGFFYKLTGTKKFTIAANNGATDRKDLIVIRADLSKSAVTMELVQGSPAKTPVEPQPKRTSGATWELAVTAVNVPANNGAVSASRRIPHPMPEPVAYPWYMTDSAALLPRSQFVYDLDTNNDFTPTEGFNSRDGYILTRTLGKSRTFTPGLLNNASTPAAANRVGRWRWIAPNTFWFSANITVEKVVNVSGTNTRIGITLPKDTNKNTYQTLHGFITNPDSNGGAPNIMAVTAITSPGSNSLYLYVPGWNSLAEGLNGLRSFPANSKFYISGVLEANEFNE
ncbi:hypothetical protein ACFWOT_09170 [Streptomyces sp. NPDC058440]|uniref:hypothetical protein n=1 Tax=Streptomyces sp. NPDC058440 TaxID=3346501 RepID=UPI003656233B